LKTFVLNHTRSFIAALLLSASLGGCATYPGWMPASGPSREQVQNNTGTNGKDAIVVIDVNQEVARQLLENHKQVLFSNTFSTPRRTGYMIGAGDVIEVSIWEAPPAMLFGGSTLSATSAPSTTRVTTFPEQMVGQDGKINIPFAGQIASAGKTPQQIEAEVAQRLKGKANQPQVLVRVIKNNTANVTVVGEVGASARVPLTARGERLLDALAAAGGVRQPVNKMTLQLTRGNQVQSLPLDTIIRDPKQNIVLQPGDVITALFQPLSFTVLGATGKNEEINFEAQGITLAQALARAGGLNDARADARTVFLFRFEDSKALNWKTPPTTTPDGKVAVIYQVDLRDPASFFVAQSFPMDNKDILYVSNAPGADLQKFLNIVLSAVYPIVNVINLKP
jgi:polysaccharide export outer membrane protein